MFWILLGTIIFLIVVQFLYKLVEDEEFNKLPGPKPSPLTQNSLDFIMDPVKLFYYFRKLANNYKNLFKVNVCFKNVIVLYNPEDVEVLLSATKHNNNKGFLYKFIQPWLQEGLLLSSGAKWLHRRKILTPTFHFKILRHFHPILSENSLKMVEQLRGEVGKPQTDISTFISDFTLNSICETAMGITLDEESNNFGKRYKNGIYELGQVLVYRAQRIWTYPNWIFNLTRYGKQQKKILDLLSSFRDNVINNRRDACNFENLILEAESSDELSKDPTSNDLRRKKLAMLDLLLLAEKRGMIDAKGIGEEVDTFMFEGHDTTATALQFLFMSLAYYTDVQDKARRELDEIFGKSDRQATLADIGQMKYLECCIKEAMRLYPPVHFIMRKITEDTKMKNYTIRAGTECAVLVYDLHRRDDQFVEPLEFRPDRFMGEPTWHPYSYVPFSAGPRNCIGQKFAMMEMKLVTSAVLRHYKLLPVTKPQDIIFITDFILRPNHKVFVKFENRHV